MVLLFLGSAGRLRRVPVDPAVGARALILLYAAVRSINTMVLAGFALVFSRLIDNAVIVLEKHLPAPGAR
jgi:multidrug efflux pump subunit AcrB